MNRDGLRLYCFGMRFYNNGLHGGSARGFPVRFPTRAFMCSRCVRVGSLRVLQLPPTVQKPVRLIVPRSECERAWLSLCGPYILNMYFVYATIAPTVLFFYIKIHDAF